MSTLLLLLLSPSPFDVQSTQSIKGKVVETHSINVLMYGEWYTQTTHTDTSEVERYTLMAFSNTL